MPQFHLGTPATDQEVAKWNTAIRPDGKGLPPGSGTPPDGHRIYQQRCQYCHGIDGQGGPNDKLVGRVSEDHFPFAEKDAPRKTIGNYWPWATTVFDYIRRTMPYTEPGSLSDNEVYALTAYLLHLNSIIPENFILSATTLPDIVMPARNRFVSDNRLEKQEIR
ncbi:c-type cytochrome [Sansalvadorimonas verongulae]|uniref:c-type cytochrome n=1 Tax=Sansalvadorimonas verongulae TaxID=2172824 RepID=UPI001E300598|nr:cytochrome c [Sansalvadorimonas verongulae]